MNGGRYYHGPRRDEVPLDVHDRLRRDEAELLRRQTPEEERTQEILVPLPPRPPPRAEPARRVDTPAPRVHRESEPEIVKQARQAKLLWPVVVVVVTIVGWTIGTVAWIEGRIDRAKEAADEVMRERFDAQRTRIERLERYVDELRDRRP